MKTFKFTKKQLLMFLMVFISTAIAAAQTVGYGNVKCSVTKQDGKYSLMVTIKSSKYKYLSNPTMMIRTFDDNVIKLQGTHLGDNSVSGGGLFIGGIFCADTDIVTSAQFPITTEQFEQINKGIKKIRLSTTPEIHEKNFSKDKIGRKLYKMYLKAKDIDEGF